MATNVISGLIAALVLLLLAQAAREWVAHQMNKGENWARTEMLKDYFHANTELRRCQKANGALRERIGQQRVQILEVQDAKRQLQLQLDAALSAAQRPATPDPDREPTFTEIVTEIASHVSTLKEEPALGTAPEPANQVVAGTVVTTPTGTDLNHG